MQGDSYQNNDLPHKSYAYGCTTVFWRNNNSITVVLYGATPQNPIAINRYNGTGWDGWEIYIRNSDFKSSKVIGTYTDVGIYVTEDVSKYNMLLFRVYVGSIFMFEFLPVSVISLASGGGWRTVTENGRITFRFETATSFQIVDVTDPNFKNITVYGL